MNTISASEFKAKCLAILDQVARTGQAIIIKKRGKPVARLGPVVHQSGRYPQDGLRGSVKVLGNILGPVLPPDAWEAERPKK